MYVLYMYRYNELAAEGNEDDNNLVDKVYTRHFIIPYVIYLLLCYIN